MESRIAGSRNVEKAGPARPDFLNKTICRLFEDQAKHTPDAIALISEEHEFSYDQVDRAANSIARLLTKSGACIGDFIPILMPRSVDLVVAQLAVLKIGGIYVPIDPEIPTERKEFIIRDCRASCVVVSSANSVEREMPCIVPDALEKLFELQSAPDLETPDATIPATSAAYVMYTSGSTGAPKGVVVSHQGVSRLVVYNGYLEIGGNDRVAHCSNPSFDAATFEIWGALLNGAALVIVPQLVLLNTKKLTEFLPRRVSIMFMTTALFNQYALNCPEIFASLRCLLFGGEAGDPHCVNEVLSHGPPVQLINAYGPTETTTFASSWVASAMSDLTTRVPIGRPISYTSIYAFDDEHLPVPTGELGEIYIGGPGVALGYLNRPALTAESFVPDPISQIPGARLYKTGDRGFQNAHGDLELYGRTDFQVKIRGFRVELGEVETALRRIPGIRQALVMAREDQPGSRTLVAYVVVSIPESGKYAENRVAPWIKAKLNETLPHYMVPTSIVAVTKMPLTSNGKFDRSALPHPTGREASTDYVAPRNGREELLVELWQDILGVNEVGIDDNFLELGGNSLLVIKATAAIGEAFNADVPVMATFQYPTIRTLSDFLDKVLT